MSETVVGEKGMITAPHRAAAEAGAEVLREGGNAIEAMISAAATIAVAYPHMNGIGGDRFWTIASPGAPVVGIESSGTAARAVSIEWYAKRGFERIPGRGPLAANTVAGDGPGLGT